MTRILTRISVDWVEMEDECPLEDGMRAVCILAPFVLFKTRREHTMKEPIVYLYRGQYVKWCKVQCFSRMLHNIAIQWLNGITIDTVSPTYL